MTEPTDIDDGQVAPWYIVFEAWHPFVHLGLDGLAWPLDGSAESSLRLDRTRSYLPFDIGGCAFTVCYDVDRARVHFEVAAACVDRAYLLELGTLESPMLLVDGFDVGRPNGGFSVIQARQLQEKTDDPRRRWK